MGMYVYLFTKGPQVRARYNGQTIYLSHYRYGYKPYWSSFSDPPVWSMWDALADKSYNNRPFDFAYTGDAPEEGANVYTNLLSSRWEDTREFPGLLIGYLHKAGRTWVVESEWQGTRLSGQPFVNRVILPGVYERKTVLSDGNTHLCYYDSRPTCLRPDTSIPRSVVGYP